MSPSGSEVLVDVEGRTLRISNLDKVLYPRTGTTKGEVLNYYARVAPVLLPHLADRPVTRIRWPHGVEGASFFEKNVPAGTPSWVRTATVPTTGSRAARSARDGGGDTLVFPTIDDLATLTWLVNLAALELHVHQWTVGRNGRPRNADRLVVDLDPGEPAGLHECCTVALLVRDKLAERGLHATPVTSGSKGLHLYADLPKRLPSDESTALAREVAEELQGEQPTLVTATMTKAKRPGKVFLDWSQNAGSKTTISPYSLRGRDRPYVATPVTWEEVEAGAEDPLGIEQYRYDEVLDRVADLGDLFAARSRDTQRVPPVLFTRSTGGLHEVSDGFGDSREGVSPHRPPWGGWCPSGVLGGASDGHPPRDRVFSGKRLVWRSSLLPGRRRRRGGPGSSSRSRSSRRSRCSRCCPSASASSGTSSPATRCRPASGAGRSCWSATCRSATCGPVT
jgi:bifunctional non-homologous end joining protein LigD